jgi:hypothetical protein
MSGPNQKRAGHACNLSYSGGRDQEDHGSKAAGANSLRDPTSKKIHHKKRAGGVAQGIGPEFKPQYQKKKGKKQKRERKRAGVLRFC